MTPEIFKEAELVIRFKRSFIKLSKLRYDLNITISGSVVECDELVIPKTADPTHYRYFWLVGSRLSSSLIFILLLNIAKIYSPPLTASAKAIAMAQASSNERAAKIITDLTA
jgi:hypothetical protein